MTRRTWLATAATAVLAAAGGLGWQLLRRDPPVGPAPAGLWELRLDRPDGGKLNVSDFRGKIVVLNFWATWCPPCIAELPEFDRLYRARSASGIEVLGIAVDRLPAVREFLQRSPVAFAVGMAGFEGIELTRQLGNETGALPFTVLLDRSGAIRQRKLGQTDFGELTRWLDDLAG